MGDNAELIELLRLHSKMRYDSHRNLWIFLSEKDEYVERAADALAKAAERIAELERERDGWRTDALLAESRVAECNQRAEVAEAERDAALKETAKYAREAGEAKGKLEMSEAAGIVEGWRERAEAAEARATALEARVRALEEALTPSEFTKAAYQGRFEFSVFEKPYLVPWVVIKQIMAHILNFAALAQSGEG